jgi:hypothetical protein
MTEAWLRGTRSAGAPTREADPLAFTEERDGYWGTGARGRRWHISKVVTGWRLDFRDPGDEAFTYAGIHATVELAKREAALVTGIGRRAGR